MQSTKKLYAQDFLRPEQQQDLYYKYTGTRNESAAAPQKT
jgi:hypothetical protein